MHDENRFIWELAPVGMAKVEQSGKFHAVNPRFCELTGYSETELLKRRFQEITHPDDVAADSAEAENLAAGNANSYQMVKRYLSKDGRIVWASLYVHALRDAHGGFLHFLAFAIELRNVAVSGDGHSANPGRAGNPSISLWEYVRTKPKEAIAILISVAAAARGEKLVDIIKAWFVK